MRIRILLADDHKIVRQGLRPLLEAEEGFRVIGEAESGLETLRKIVSLRPDVVVLDLNLPDLSGAEVIRRVEQIPNPPCIVILTMMEKGAAVFEALQHGNAGYVTKGEGIAPLAEAIRMAMCGERYLGTTITEDNIREYTRQTQSQELDLLDTLTRREFEIFILVIEGSTNSEIAERLSISRRTVEKHREHIMDKLHLQSQNELLRFAAEHGMLLTHRSD